MSLSRVLSCSRRWRASSAAFSASIFSWISSSFFASKSSFGTPCGFACALRHKVHSSLQKPAVSFSRKPVSWIWRVFMSGKREFSRRLKQSSITTSSSEPRISEILPAIHFFMTSTLTFSMSTFWLNSGGNFVRFRSF